MKTEIYLWGTISLWTYLITVYKEQQWGIYRTRNIEANKGMNKIYEMVYAWEYVQTWRNQRRGGSPH